MTLKHIAAEADKPVALQLDWKTKITDLYLQ